MIFKIYIALMLFCLCLIISFKASAENITPEVYPSDEELYEAYLRGDIDYQSYINLLEIFDGGIDSTEIYLLEEIPNISFFLKSYMKNYSELEMEQTEPFVKKDKVRTGWLKTRTYQKLDEEGVFKNYAQFKTALSADWSCRVEYKQDYEGKRKWTRRSLYYNGRSGNIKKMIIGNFTTRFGLGLTVGYRGKLMDKSLSSPEQTLVFPDYGGFNGLYIEGGRQKDVLKMLLHYDRNDEYELRLGALENMRRFGSFKWEGIVLGAIIKNRMSDDKYTHYQLGTCLRYSQYYYSLAAEAAFARGKDAMVPAMILESEYKKDRLNLKFTAWHYGEGFINFAGGGRAGGYYQTVRIDTVDFEFRDKRTDQRGMLFKSRLGFDNDIMCSFSFSAYGKNSFEKAVSILSGFTIPLNDNSKAGIDFSCSRRDEPGETISDNEVRTVYRLKKDKFSLRSYLGYSLDKNDCKYISYFTRIKADVANLGRLELWFNMDKINYEIGRIDYFYGYVKEIVNLLSSLELAAKYSYRYSRYYSDREQSVFILEMKLKW